MNFLESSQLVVVGSFSVSCWCTALNSRESMTLRSLPGAHGSPVVIAVSALVSQVTEPLPLVQLLSGQPSL